MATDDPRSLATLQNDRVEKLREYGRRIAEQLRTDDGCFQEQAAMKAGISVRSYYDYLAKEGDEYDAFREEVLPALYEQARKAEGTAERDIGSAPTGSGAWASWHRWKLEKRYRKIYGDLAQAPTKIEVTGKDGGALEFKPVDRMSLAEIREESAKLAAEIEAHTRTGAPDRDVVDGDDG